MTVFNIEAIAPLFHSVQPPQETTFSEDQVDNGPNDRVVETMQHQQQQQQQPREFLRDDLMLTDKLGEGEYGPIYR